MLNNTTTQNTTRPSTSFVVKAGVVIVGIIIFILYQKGGFAFLQKKATIKNSVDKNTADTSQSLTVDSNGNSIPDWEERLWGLDPTKNTTNGIANSQIIEGKKKDLTKKVATTTKVNKTEEIAQSLFVINSAMSTKGASEQENASNNAVDEITNKIKPLQYKNHYSAQSIKKVKTTTKSVILYQKELVKNLELSASSDDEITIIIDALQNADYSNIPKLVAIGKNYQKIAQKIAATSTPIGISRAHLLIVNDIYNVGQALIDTAVISEDPVSATIAIAAYKNYSLRLQTDIFDANQLIVRYTSN